MNNTTHSNSNQQNQQDQWPSTIVLVFVQQEGEPRYCIGQVAVENTLLRASEPDALLEELWAEWREDVEEPDSDSEFIDWLVANKPGFDAVVMPVTYTVIKV